MKVELYNRMVMNRRTWLKGSAAVSAATVSGALAATSTAAVAADDLRAQLLQIPGVGKGSPTDADWQKVGELCLGATKVNVKEGEFKVLNSHSWASTTRTFTTFCSVVS